MNKYQGTAIERRCLQSAVALACVAAFFHVIACALEHWVVCSPMQQVHNVTLSSKAGAKNKASGIISPFLYFEPGLNGYVCTMVSGLWRTCYTYVPSGTPYVDCLYSKRTIYRCEYVEFEAHWIEDQGQPDNEQKYQVHDTTVGLRSAMIAVALLALFMMGLCIGFGAYAVRLPRYTFKRLALVIHVFAAVLVLIQLQLVASSKAARHFDQDYVPHQSLLSGCWYLCCSEVALLGVGGIVYALFAKKLTPRSRVEYGITDRAAEANAEILLS